jgi:ABC-type antimicrobial peptide transport system permease subunit
VGASDGGTASVAGSPYPTVASAAVGTGLANYAISYVPGELTVTQASLTVTADDQTKTYGQTVVFAGTEFTTSGLLGPDAVTSVTLASPGAGLLGAAGSPTVTASTVAIVIGVALAVAVLATLIPALQAARTSTINALADAARPPKRG